MNVPANAEIADAVALLRSGDIKDVANEGDVNVSPYEGPSAPSYLLKNIIFGTWPNTAVKFGWWSITVRIEDAALWDAISDYMDGTRGYASTWRDRGDEVLRRRFGRLAFEVSMPPPMVAS